MGLREEEIVACRNDDEREEDEELGLALAQAQQQQQQQLQWFAVGVAGSPLQPRKLLVVGYALTSKKTKSFLQPKLEGLARNKGILFVAIDQSKPLSDQGPFDIVLHKLSGKEWRRIIESACSFLHLESLPNIRSRPQGSR